MTEEKILEIPLTKIFADADFNCRGVISPADVIDLAAKIKSDGLLQPIVIAPYLQDGYEWKIVCGHRRYAACKLNGSETILCRAIPKMPELDALVLNINENTQRKDLNMMQEARTIERFRKGGWSLETICEKLRQPKKWVKVRVALLELPSEIQERAEAGLLTQHQVDDISQLPSEEDMYEYTKKAVDWRLQGERGTFKGDRPNKPKASAHTGDVRTKEEIFAMQDLVQESLGQTHEAAVAFAYAAGVISEEAFRDEVEKWKDSSNSVATAR